MTHGKVDYTFLRVMIPTVASFLDSEQEKERREQVPKKRILFSDYR